MKIDDSALQEFLNNRRLRPSTVENYIQNLNRYSEIVGLSLKELLEEAEADEDSGVRMRKRRIKKHLQAYYQTLLDREYSPYTIKHGMNIVRSFYHEFDIQLPRLKVSTKDYSREGADQIPDHDDIRKALENANPKYQAIILLMASSGMGSAEVRALKVQDFIKAFNSSSEMAINGPFDIVEMINLAPKNTPLVWHIRRVKTNMPYFTFSTPESTRAILRYLELTPPDNTEQYLFPSVRGGELGGRTLSIYFKRLNDKCGFPVFENQVFFHSHALRKFFATTLTRANLPQLKIDWMLGHRINPVTEAYFKPTVDGLKRDYLIAMPSLVFTEKVRVRMVTDERLQEMEDKLRVMEEDNIAQQEKLEVLEKKVTPEEIIGYFEDMNKK